MIDPGAGAVLPDGEKGELVLTSLTKEAMPVVRYRTRDLTRLLAGTARSMRRIEKITGRADDMIVVRGVNLFPSQIEEQILKCAGLAPHFQIELTRERRLDAMAIIVESRPDAATQTARERSGRELAHHVKSLLGVTAKVRVVGPGSVERSQGKAKRILDKRTRE